MGGGGGGGGSWVVLAQVCYTREYLEGQVCCQQSEESSKKQALMQLVSNGKFYPMPVIVHAVRFLEGPMCESMDESNFLSSYHIMERS